LADDAKTSNDMDEFVRYQSVAYQKLDQIETTDYTFHIYQVIAQTNDTYINQFSVFVVPKSDVMHATTLDDTSDETGIVLTNTGNNEILYQTSTDDNYTTYAVSYGIEKIGFYYYAVPLTESYQLEMTLVDYQDQTILSQTVNFTYIAYDPNQLGSLTLGYTDDEVANLLNLGAYVQPVLFQNITIYLVIDIVVGALIHFLLKKKILIK